MDRWPFFTLALAALWRAMYALIVVLMFAVLAPLIAVALWPTYEAAGVGVSVCAFALCIAAARILASSRRENRA